MKKILLCLPFLVLSVDTHASTAYGTLNNFDTVNDTGVPCHGFVIEIDDVPSTAITYTYDYNHYGPPKITEDKSDPLHPKTFVRYESPKDASGNFTAFTAVPTAPIAPTDGHQCTNPGVNFGCEHFGVGYYGNAGMVKYNWLIEDSANIGSLILGPAVNVATPTWTYYPPVVVPVPDQPPIIQPAQVIAKIVAPPEPPEIEDPENKIEFGEAVWVKQIKTTSHNNNKVELRDLVSDDPDNPDDKNWANGEQPEPDEVETEWEIQQIEFKNANGANNEKIGKPEELPDGDEVVTRRYEFYEYIGPFKESYEIVCDKWKDKWTAGEWTADEIANLKDECKDPVDNTKPLKIVGPYIGAQMAAFNAEAPLGLIDNLQAGDYQVPYVDRTVVIGGNSPYLIDVTEGSLPGGLSFNADGILSGTPAQAGNFTFKVEATDTADPGIGHVAGTVSKVYTLNIVPPVIPPIQFINNIPDGNANVPYPATTLVVDGNPPYVTKITSGALPVGLSVDAGILHGTTNQSGNFTFTVEATDTADADKSHLAETVSKAYTLKIIAPVIPKGDLDSDGDIDLNDLNLLRSKFGQAVGPADPYDMNGDGTINVLDLRKAITLCTRPSCAVN